MEVQHLKFTAKEMDSETGLYYYGARYMDPRLGRFISVDPPMMTGEYLPTGNAKKDANLPGMGGVFNSVNLNAYQYAGNNPVRYIDPDGRVTDEKFNAIEQKLNNDAKSPEWSKKNDLTAKTWKLIEKNDLKETKVAIDKAYEYSKNSQNKGVKGFDIVNKRETAILNKFIKDERDDISKRVYNEFTGWSDNARLCRNVNSGEMAISNLHFELPSPDTVNTVKRVHWDRFDGSKDPGTLTKHFIVDYLRIPIPFTLD